MRQLYEASCDRALQVVVLEYLQSVALSKMGEEWRVSMTEPNAFLDYIWWKDGNAIHYAELKRRNNAHNTYPDYMISLSKLKKIQAECRRGFLFVLFSDGLFYKTIDRGEEFNVKHGGRTKAVRDKWDANGEDCAYIPHQQLRLAAGWSEWWQLRARNALHGITDTD